MGFNLFGSSSENKTVNETQNFNQQVAAQEEGFAVGSGASVRIEETSDDVAKEAIRNIGDVSLESFDVAESAIDSSSQASRDVLDFSNEFADDALGFVNAFTRESFDAQRDVADTTADLATTTTREGLDFGRDSLGFADAFTRNIINADVINREDQLESLETAREQNFNLARQTAELAAAQAGVVPPAQNKELIRTLGLGIIVSVASAALITFLNLRSKK